MKSSKGMNIIMGITFMVAIIFTVAINFVFSSDTSNNIYELNKWQLNGKTVEMPLSINLSENEEKLVIERNILDVNASKKHLLLSVKYNAVKVYVDDKLTYESNDPRYHMKSAGVESKIVDLSELKDNSVIRIELTPYLENNYAANIDTPLLGNTMSILNYIFANNLFDVIMEVSLFIIGIFLLFVHFLMKKEESSRLDFWLLGILSIVCGGYTLVQMPFIRLVITNSYFLYYIEFVFLMLIPLVVLQLLMKNINAKMEKVFSILQVILIANFIFQHIAHFILRIEFRELILLTHICILMVVVAFVCAIIMSIKVMTKQNKETVWSLFPALIGGSIDLGLSYLGFTSKYYSAYYFKIGLFIFIGMQVYYNYQRFIYNLNERLKAETYRQLAYTDALTKLNNRLAFETDLKLINDNVEVKATCISIDINDLKIVNDTMGHKKGDELIISIASVLQKAVEEDGKIYRIGGDEFIILTSLDEDEIKLLLNRIDEECKREQLNHDFNISYAIGYSAYQQSDENAEKMIARADKNMYEDKYIYKQKGTRCSLV